MRKEFEMSEEDLATLLTACRSPMYIVANGVPPMDPQESANRAWCELGARMGFDGNTAKPIPDKDERHFTAEVKAATAPTVEPSKNDRDIAELQALLDPVTPGVDVVAAVKHMLAMRDYLFSSANVYRQALEHILSIPDPYVPQWLTDRARAALKDGAK